MLGELQKKKITKEFEALDHNKSGFLSEEDFFLKYEKDSRLAGFEPGSSEGEVMRLNNVERWKDIQQQIDKDGDSQISLEEWLDYHDQVLSGGRFDEVMGKGISTHFDTDDTDGDGKIKADIFLNNRKESFDMKEDELDEMRKRFDPNKDGYIEREDMLRLTREFYMSNDPEAPGNWYAGRL